MRLAIDAITQAEGAAPPVVAPPPAPARSQKPATTPAAPVTATVLPTAQQPTPPEQSVNAPAPENATSVVDQTPDGQNGDNVKFVYMGMLVSCILCWPVLKYSKDREQHRKSKALSSHVKG